jgi:hypothetical protein
LDDIKVAKDPLEAGADNTTCLAPKALCRTGNIGDELREFVEKGIVGLWHGGGSCMSNKG